MKRRRRRRSQASRLLPILAPLALVGALAVLVLFWNSQGSRGRTDEVEGSRAAAEQYAELGDSTTEIIRALFELGPSDTSAVAQERAYALASAEALQPLAESAGSVCDDLTRQNQGNPLTQRVVVKPEDIGYILPDDTNPALSINVFFTLMQVMASGDPYRGSATCPAKVEAVVTAFWQQQPDGDWMLVAITPPEVPE